MMTSEQKLTYHCPHCQSAVESEPRPEGEMVVCPDCHKPFHPAPPSAQPEPTRGLVVPSEIGEPEEHPVSEVKVTEAGERPKPAQDAGEVEEEVLRWHPAMFQAYPLRCILYVLIGIAGVVGLSNGLYNDSMWLWVLGLLAMGFSLLKLVGWYFRIRHTDVRITNRRVIVESGYFSRNLIEVPHSNISNIYVSQDTFNRFTNIGDILISTTGNDKRTLVLMSVVDPEGVAEKIREQRRDRA